MDYLKQSVEFDKRSEGLKPLSYTLYRRLFAIANERFWADEWLSVSNATLAEKCGVKKRDTLIAARDELIEKGFIAYQFGNKKSAGRYKIIQLYEQDNAQKSGIIEQDNAQKSGIKQDKAEKDNAQKSGIKKEIMPKNRALSEKIMPEKRAHIKNNIYLKHFKTIGDFSTLENSISDFIEFRKKIKSPMTEKAVELLIQKLHKLSNGEEEKAIAILEQSILNGWRGIFELKNDSVKGVKANGTQRTSSAERDRQAWFEQLRQLEERREREYQEQVAQYEREEREEAERKARASS